MTLRNVISEMLAFSSQWPLKPGKVYSRGTRKFKYTIDIILQDEKKKKLWKENYALVQLQCTVLKKDSQVWYFRHYPSWNLQKSL